MRVVTGVCALVALAFVAAGCSTHEEEYVDQGIETEAASRESLIPRVRALLDEVQPSRPAGLEEMPTHTLSILLSSAATAAVAANGQRHEAAARRYAEWLAARSRGGMFPVSPGGENDALATAAAGAAFIDAFVAVAEPRYAKLATAAAAAVADRRLGWRRTSQGVGVSRRDVPDSVDISRTAEAFRLLWRSNRILNTPSSADARAALDTLVQEQAAVGRWYAIEKREIPMTLLEWATTLDAVSIAKGTDGEGLAGAGVAGLWRAAFFDDGGIRQNSLTQGSGGTVGLAASLALFAAYADDGFANRSVPNAVLKIRQRAERQPQVRDLVRAYLALALARRWASLSR